ncbi:hypothetical protein L6164_007684 [Bauhinia variegata]|uniref:Uncharacterized protein n=1 Tax=Bauhinia variegata TaxID=167791 RepID=A0ACB9PFS3_BAUVA|nr:hypothetical protein L6164_007684 [Bauhinia variegata]
MFSSTYSSNPFPCFPSSSSSYPPHLPYLTHENAAASADNILILHDPLAAIPFIATNNAPIPEAVTNLAAAAADFAAGIAKQDEVPLPPHFLTNKRAPKKDRHSKIYTSQGLRDRRVRLSIEIARKFFDLQDMLGFDKASNTLEWLFTKSKKAIKDLALSKNSSSAGGGDSDGAKSFSSSSDCDEVVSGINQVVNMDIVPNLKGNDDSNEKSLMGFDAAVAKEKKLKRAQKDIQPVFVRAKKESREKARARARERTSYKMCTTTSTGRVQELKKRCSAAENPQILHQLRSPVTQPAEASAKSPRFLQPHPVTSEAQRDSLNVIEKSVVIKRKLKPSMVSSSHHHQSLVIPKEPCFDQNEQHPFPNLAPNWDTNSGIGRSSYCAFASMNLSTELQIFGKPWEECTNQQRLE